MWIDNLVAIITTQQGPCLLVVDVTCVSSTNKDITNQSKTKYNNINTYILNVTHIQV